MKNFDWNSIDELLMEELIYNFNYIDQYIKLKGWQVDVGKGISQNFELSCEGFMLGGGERYKHDVGTYSDGKKQDHYVPHFVYLIIQTSLK